MAEIVGASRYVSGMVVNIQGWNLPEHEIRRQRLLRWLVAADKQSVQDVTTFYAGRELDPALGRTDMDALAGREFALNVSGMGHPMAKILPQGKAQVKAWDTSFDEPRPRQATCRVALLDWLCSINATVEAGKSSTFDRFFQGDRSWYWGRQFSEEDVNKASGHLYRNGLITGITGAETVGLLNAMVTNDGIRCVDNYEGDVAAYVDKRNGDSPAPAFGVPLADPGGLTTTSWAALSTRLDGIGSELRSASSQDDLQDVGRRCREVLIDLAQLLADPSIVPAGQDQPKAGDAKNWLELWLLAQAGGDAYEKLRTFIRASWNLAQRVTHADVTRVETYAAAQATILIVRTLQQLANA